MNFPTIIVSGLVGALVGAWMTWIVNVWRSHVDNANAISRIRLEKRLQLASDLHRLVTLIHDHESVVWFGTRLDDVPENDFRRKRIREAINALMQYAIFLEQDELIKINQALREAQKAVNTLEEAKPISTDEDQRLMEVVMSVANVSAEIFADDIRPRKFEWAEAWKRL